MFRFLVLFEIFFTNYSHSDVFDCNAQNHLIKLTDERCDFSDPNLLPVWKQNMKTAGIPKLGIVL